MIAVGERWFCRGGGQWDVVAKDGDEYVLKAADAEWYTRCQENGKPLGYANDQWGAMDLVPNESVRVRPD